MFPVERPALLHDLARKMRGYPLGNSVGSLLKLLNEDAVDKIIDSTWNRIWTRFLTFGTTSAGLITILIIIHFIEITIDIILQGYAIHSIYGWSVHLLGAVWTSVSHFLVYTTMGKNLGEFLILTSRANQIGQTLLFLCWSYCH